MAAGARIVNVPISRGCRGCPPEKLPSHPQTPISPNSQNLTQLSGLKRIFRSNPHNVFAKLTVGKFTETSFLEFLTGCH